MISTLQELIAPLTLARFYELLNDRALYFQRGSNGERFKELLDWNGLRGIVESGVLAADKFRITKKTKLVPSMFYAQNEKISLDAFDKLFRKGASLVTKPIEKLVPPLAVLSADIQARTGDSIRVHAVATTGEGGALVRHIDYADLIVVQLQGSKRWRIYGPPVLNPIRGMDTPPAPETAPQFDEVLHAGDLLLMPGGYWHHCDNSAELSLHIAILLYSPTGWHAVEAMLSQLLGEELFRLPFTRLAGTAEMAKLEAELKARLTARIEQMSMADVATAARKINSEADSENY